MAYETMQADLQRDRETVLRFWRSQHGTGMERKFRWLYEGNPDGEPYVWLVKHTETGECVGMQTLFPRRFRLGSSLRRAVVAGDLLIHPRHRTAGPAMMLQRRLTSVVGKGADFIYGFPNKSAEPLLKRAGFRALGSLARYVRPIRSAPLLRERGWSPLAAGLAGASYDFFSRQRAAASRYRARNYHYEGIDRFDERFDRLWSDRRRLLQVTAERDAAYMNWKFLWSPISANHAVAIFNGDESEMKACIVYRSDDESIEIREFIPGDDPRATGVLFGRFLQQVSDEARPRSIVMNVLERSILGRELSRLGFVRREGARNAYVWPALEDPLNDCATTERWLLVKSDEEV